GLRELMALQQPAGGQVEDAVHPLHAALQGVSMQDVAADGVDAHPLVTLCIAEVFETAARQVIVDDDFFDVSLEQRLDNVAADEPRSADHHDARASDIHNFSFRRECTASSPSIA